MRSVNIDGRLRVYHAECASASFRRLNVLLWATCVPVIIPLLRVLYVSGENSACPPASSTPHDRVEKALGTNLTATYSGTVSVI